MKLKIILAILLLACVFGVAGNVLAMTDAEKAALIAQLQAQLVLLQQQLQQIIAQQGTPTGTSGAWCYTFNTNLGYAQSGSSDVGQLHTALQKEGISYSPDTGNVYSTGTSAAVTQFQTKYSISPQSGYVGSLTRNKLNSLYGCGMSGGITAVTCAASCISQSDGLYAADCNGNPTKCGTGEICQQIYNTTLENHNGTVVPNKTLTGASCTVNNTSGNTTCNASCVSQSEGLYATDCNGNPTKCESGSTTCQQTYNTTYVNNSGVISQVKKLTGAQCVYSSTAANSCAADCKSQTDGIYSVDCYGGVQKCDEGKSCQKIYSTTYKLNSSGVAVPTQNLTGAQCVGDTGTGTNTCNATCYTGTDGIYKVDCNGDAIKCNTGESCQQTYTTSSKYVNGQLVTERNLTGSECVAPVITYTCQANCVTNSTGTFAVDCYGNAAKCDAGYTCEKLFEPKNTYINGAIQTENVLTGSQCVAPATTTTCQANCVTNTTGTFAVDCYGYTTKCDTGSTCEKLFETKNTYVNGTVQTENILVGSQCVAPAYSSSCQANCVTNSSGIFSVDCYGYVTKCDAGSTCQKLFEPKNTYVNGVVQTSQVLVGSECVCTSNWQCDAWSTCSGGQQNRNCTDRNNCLYPTNQPETSQSCATTCLAVCKTQSGILYAVDCDGGVMQCSTEDTCELTYDVTQTYNPVTGLIETKQTLNGSQCVALPVTY